MNHCEHPVMHEEFGEPLPMKRHGRRHRPLETEGERDAWLPPSHPYPEISRTLRMIVLSLLALMVFLTTVLFALWTAAH
jgi:hypothetical protein